MWPRDSWLPVLVSCLQHLPVLFVLISTAAAALYKDILGNVPFIVFGTYTSWLYLRFFQWKPELGLK